MNGQSRTKRSTHLALTALMAGTAVSITACDASSPIAQWDSPAAAEASRPVDVKAFANLQECEASGLTVEVCETSLAQAKNAQGDVPRYDDAQSCEDKYGAGQCVPRSSNGGSFFTPLLTGFIVGQALNGGGYRGAPLYRDRDGGFFSSGGAGLTRDYVTGRTQMKSDVFSPPSQARPARVQSRSSVISRGGFGGGHGFGG